VQEIEGGDDLPSHRRGNAVQNGRKPRNASPINPTSQLVTPCAEAQAPGPAVVVVGLALDPATPLKMIHHSTHRAPGEPEGPRQIKLANARVAQQLHEGMSVGHGEGLVAGRAVGVQQAKTADE